MPNDSRKDNSNESPQYRLRQAEVSGWDILTKRRQISPAIGIALFVIAGLAVAALVRIVSGASGEVSSRLNAVAEAEPFWGGLLAFVGTIGSFLGAGIGWFFSYLIIMAIFAAGIYAITASGKSRRRGIGVKMARGCGITVLSFVLTAWAIGIWSKF